MAEPRLAQSNQSRNLEEAAAMVRRDCEPLPPAEDAALFGPLFKRFGDAKLVLLGEATHGTAEFYLARAAITRQLIAHHGFTIVAVEADWPDAMHVDANVRHRRMPDGAEPPFSRFPTWMWRNREMIQFIAWLREHNEPLRRESRVEFRGLDIYSLGRSMGAVLRYLDRIDPEAAAHARARYGCLTPWQYVPEQYGRAVLRGETKGCEDEAVETLVTLLEKSLDEIKADGDELFDALQNARIVRAAELYYRVMYRGARESWNLRDRHMFDTLQAVMQHRGPDAKAVVWAHNSHIGNAAATVMGWEGEFNIGELCRTAYGSDCRLIGFGTDRGTVLAASDWGGQHYVKAVVPSRPDSYERVFRQSNVARSLTDWTSLERRELRELLAAARLERAIGVIYRPETERASHYFDAVLPEQFDAYVWFEQSRAVTPIGVERPAEEPGTFPFGL